MQFNFASACKTAKSSIVVPQAPLGAIRANSATVGVRKRFEKTIPAICAVVVTLTMTGVALAFGGKIASAIKILVSPNGQVTVRSKRLSFYGPMTAKGLLRLVSALPYPAVLPMGLPARARLVYVMSLSSSDLALTYGYLPGDKAGDLRWFSVLISPAAPQLPQPSPSATRRGGATLSFGTGSKVSAHWTSRSESVSVISVALTPMELSRMRRAMSGASPKASLDAASAILGGIHVVGNPSNLSEAWDRLQSAQYPTLVDGRIVAALSQFVDKNLGATEKNSSIYITQATTGTPVLSLRRALATFPRYRKGAPSGRISESFQTTDPQTVRIVDSLEMPRPGANDYLVFRPDRAVARVRVLPREHQGNVACDREYIVELKSMTARRVSPSNC